MTRAATAIESSTWTDAHLHLWDSSVLAVLGAATGRAGAVIAGIDPSTANFEQELTAARAVNR
jgi:predicted TIM-barrel fold metal-dependent hydrolase